MTHFLEVFDVRWPWYMTFWAENWQTDYSCPGEHLRQFWVFHAFFSYERRTDGRARPVILLLGRPHNYLSAFIQLTSMWVKKNYRRVSCVFVHILDMLSSSASVSESVSNFIHYWPVMNKHVWCSSVIFCYINFAVPLSFAVFCCCCLAEILR